MAIKKLYRGPEKVPRIMRVPGGFISLRATVLAVCEWPIKIVECSRRERQNKMSPGERFLMQAMSRQNFGRYPSRFYVESLWEVGRLNQALHRIAAFVIFDFQN
jgi:hypothetical protein